MSEFGILDTSSPSCSVCHIAMVKEMVHYGAKSCFSCRAFFRRNSLRNKLDNCIKEGSCLISYIDRKSCASCRYEKCVRAGMKREFIAPSGGKRKRLKRAYELEDGIIKPIFTDEDSTSAMESPQDMDCERNNLNVQRGSNNENETREIIRVEEEFSESHSIHKNIVDGEKRDTFFLEETTEEDMSLIDPDTGEIVLKQTICETVPEDKNIISLSDGHNYIPDNSKGIFKDQESVIRTIPENISNKGPGPAMAITDEKSENKKLVTRCTAEHILHYIHKKFKKRYDMSVGSTTHYPYQSDIQQVTVVPQRENVELNIITKSPSQNTQNRYR